MLSRGLPQRHHVVIYMLLHSSLSHLQLQVPDFCDVSVSHSVVDEYVTRDYMLI